MGKIIITEEERFRILNLYENSVVGEEESEIVGYFNPFEHTQYLPYFRKYTSELKDGEYFFTNRNRKNQESMSFTKEADNCINTISGNINDFNNKTFRYNDYVRTITSIRYFYYTYKHQGRGIAWDFNIFDLKDESQKIPYEFYIKFNPPLEQSYPYIPIDRIVPPSILDSLNKKLGNLTAKEVDDCFFELRKVVRIKTDYKP